MKKITKRDGRVVPFNKQRIYNAVLLATKAVGSENPDIAENVADIVSEFDGELTSVETIQDRVENALMDLGHHDIAKEYILYRNERSKVRENKSRLVRTVFTKIDAKNVENNNANVDESAFDGRKKEASDAVQKIIALDSNMPEDIAKGHIDGYLYQHDLADYNVGDHNCLFIDVEHIFTNGFQTRNGAVRSPASYATACQLYAVACQCQSQAQFGGVGSSHIDYDLAPYVKKSFIKKFKQGMKYLEKDAEIPVDEEIYIDNATLQDEHPNAYAYAMDMLEIEGKQSSQALYHNLNTLESRAGGQVPFTSINLGRDTSTEGRLVTRWMMEASIDGIGKFHTTSIFPISIFSYKKGVNANPGDPNYDLKKLALKSLSKRIYPNWVNGDWSQAHEDPNDKDTFMATMGCRTLVGYDRHGLGYSRVGRGNNVPITMILPKIALECGIATGEREKPDLDMFNEKFENLLKLTEKALLDRYDIMRRQSPKSAPFMYLNGTIRNGEKCVDTVEESLKHNSLAFGFIGVAEMCQALFGKNHADGDPEVYQFALNTVKRIYDYANECSERNNLNFVCYATPAEGLCRTALVKLRNDFGVIPNITDREYITNSFHVPVWKEVSIYEKLQLEAPFTKFATGGTITYVELDSTFMKNLDAVESIIDYAFQELDIPYLAFNFPIDTCMDCGYSSEFNDCCPHCGSKNIEQLRRVTGYLTTDYSHFNAGKIAEVKDRVKHSKFTDFINKK